jgi:uncharacterized protein YjiS (DUF1127 family)
MTALALGLGPYYSGSRFPRPRDGAVTCGFYLLSIVIGKEIPMSTNQHRNLQANPAADEALESLQHMTSWARQTITSPEAAPTSTRFGSVADSLALGAFAFHPGPWMHPFDAVGEADIAIGSGAASQRPWLGMRILQAMGGVMLRFGRHLRERREVARATRVLSELDDRSLQDIGISRADIGRAARHGRDWGRWR